jgi:hypothetical protein
VREQWLAIEWVGVEISNHGVRREAMTSGRSGRAEPRKRVPGASATGKALSFQICAFDSVVSVTWRDLWAVIDEGGRSHKRKKRAEKEGTDEAIICSAGL